MKFPSIAVVMSLFVVLADNGWSADKSTQLPRVELARIATACGSIVYTVDPSSVRGKDIAILRQWFSFMVNGLHLLFSYPGYSELLANEDASLPEQHLHQGPTREQINTLISDSLFAKRAGQEWVDGFEKYPGNRLGTGLVQRLETNFGIQETNTIHSDENCHTELTF